MAFNVQTAGDEAIYCKFPGATGKPTPTSGRSISLPDGFKELRYIKDSTGKVIWAHKWRLTAKAGTGGTVSCSPAGARVKNGQTITVTATPDGTYKFTGWSDGSTTNPRSFTMTNHASITANFGSNTYTIIFKNYNASTSSAGTTLKTDQLEAGATPTPPSPLPTTPDSPVAGKTYTFTGWSPAVSKVTGHQTYVAQYSSGESTVTVTFKDYDGNVLKTSTVNYGTAATDVPKPDDPSRTGYKFTGWGNPDPASAVNASGQVIANCVYIAQYEEDVCVVSAKFKSISATTVLYNSKTLYLWETYDTFSTYTKDTVWSREGATWSFTYTLSNGETKTVSNIPVRNTYKNADIEAYIDESDCGGTGWGGGITYTKNSNGSTYGGFHWKCLKNTSHRGKSHFYSKVGHKFVSMFDH